MTTKKLSTAQMRVLKRAAAVDLLRPYANEWAPTYKLAEMGLLAKVSIYSYGITAAGYETLAKASA